MGRELGRISGPLLANNLKRNGVNLAFETQLLYFDVINNRIGINTSSPTRDLLVNSTTNLTSNTILTYTVICGSQTGQNAWFVTETPWGQLPSFVQIGWTIGLDYGQTASINNIYQYNGYTALSFDSSGIDFVYGRSYTLSNNKIVDLYVDNTAELGPNFEITNSQIQNFVDVINIVPNQSSNPVISIQNILATDNLNLRANTISATTSNTDVNISPSYTPQIGYRLVLQQDAAGNKALPFYAGGGNQFVTFTQILSSTTMALYESWLNNSATLTLNDGTIFTIANAGIGGSYGYIIIPISQGILTKTANQIWPLVLTSSDYTPELDARIVFNNNTLINGDLHATGNITWDGNITLGNSSSDTVTFGAEISSSILPTTNQVDNLGSNSLQWDNLYTNNLKIVTGYLPTLTVTSLTSGGVNLTGNTISSSDPINDITLTPSGTGIVNLINSTTQLFGSNIVNTSNLPLVLSGTNNGYIKFSGVNGLVIPSGTTGTRTTPAEQGTTRFNTELGIQEVYDNVLGWTPAKGTAPVLSYGDVSDISEIWALVLGL